MVKKIKYCCEVFKAQVEYGFFKKGTQDNYFKSGWMCRIVQIDNDGKPTESPDGWNILPLSHCPSCGEKIDF